MPNTHALTIDPALRAARALPDIASRCRSVRESLGLSRAQVAEHVGVSQERIYKVERGSSPPSVGLLQTLVRLSGRTVCDLFPLPALPVTTGRRTAFKEKVSASVTRALSTSSPTIEPEPVVPTPPAEGSELDNLRRALAAFGDNLFVSLLEPSVAKGKYVATARFGNRKKQVAFSTSLADAVVGAIALAQADAQH